MRKYGKSIALLLTMGMLLSGCGEKGAAQPEGTDSLPVQTAGESLQQQETLPGTSEADKSVYMDASQDVEVRVEALLAQMTLEEKAAQMVQPEQQGLSVLDVQQYGLGSVLSGGGSAPSYGNNPDDWQKRVNELKQAALDSRLGIPLLYGVDAVHGNNNVYGTVIFPHNVGLGAAGDTELLEKVGQAVAEEVRAIGVQWTFAPTLGNPQNERWGRTFECFSERTEDVAACGAAYVRGLQSGLDSEQYLDEKHVLACAKHYIGEGYTENGANQGNVAMTAAEFDALLQSGVLDPYTAALNEGVRTVMVSFNSVDGLKCHENKHLITKVLKEQLGFDGLVISDYNGIQQLSGASYKEQVRQAIDAGVDLAMEVTTWKDVIMHIVSLVNEGSLSQERVDDAVRRILRVKLEAGLFEEEIGGETEQELLAKVGGEEHREIAREAVRKSLVLLKNEEINGSTAMEALQDCRNIRVCGKKAFDIGSQCGGWTISWEGKSGKITKGTTIIEGLAAQTEGSKEWTHDIKGELAADNDAVIAVVGELPYVESGGDRNASDLTISSDDVQMLEALRTSLASGKKDMPVIGIILGGRPVNIAEYMDMFDAVIMAWLPGTEGEGVADVLFGEYDFTGKLTYTWVKDPENIGQKFEEGKEDLILFPYGHGLNKAGVQLP